MLDDPVADILAARARARQLSDPYVDVCFLATVNAAGVPEVRALALRDIDARGVSLLINAHSPKWEQLSATGEWSLQLFWASVQRQYRIQGQLHTMERERLEQYWSRKGHTSRLFEHYYETMQAQSQPLESRESLTHGFQVLQQRYPDASATPVAASLLGLYLYPMVIDVWHGSQLDRLHDRRLFTRTDTGWSQRLLVP